MSEDASDRRWEHFPHQADIGVRGVGPSIGAAFEEAAMALTAVITDPTLVDPVEPVTVECDAPDVEILLVDWLNALVFLMATRRMLFGRFEVNVDGLALTARAWGESVNVEKHAPAVEVKGATLTALSVRRDDRGTWTAQCVVDV